jgi:hypothetical protein
LATFLIAQQLAAALRAEHEMNDDVGKRLGHRSYALTGRGGFVREAYPAIT